MNKPNKDAPTKTRRFYQNLKPMAEKAANRSYTGVVFSFLAIALFAWYAIMPTIKTILFLKREISDQTAISKKMEDKIGAIIDAQNTLDEIGPQLPLIDQAMPPNPQVLELANQIKNLAGETGASLSAIQVASVPLAASAEGQLKTNAPPKNPVGNFQMTIVINGSFSTLKNFITGLFNLRRIITLETFNLSGDTLTKTGSVVGGSPLRMIVKISSHFFTPK